MTVSNHSQKQNSRGLPITHIHNRMRIASELPYRELDGFADIDQQVRVRTASTTATLLHLSDVRILIPFHFKICIISNTRVSYIRLSKQLSFCRKSFKETYANALKGILRVIVLPKNTPAIQFLKISRTMKNELTNAKIVMMDGTINR